MAAFNQLPQPTQDPNYLNYAKVTEGPPADTSKAMLINTASGSLDSAVGLVDTAIKKNISNKAYEGVDPIRDQYTAGLEKLKGNLDSGVIPAPVQAVAGTTTGKSLLDSNAMMDPSDNQPDIPEGVESGVGRIQQLASAKAAGSVKINDTSYAKDTLSVAKQLRAQYPGYREYIDQKVSEASGLPVANSYYQNMLIDINRQLTQMGKTKDDVGALMLKNMDVPGMGDMINKRRAGAPNAPSDAEVFSKVSDWQNQQSQIKIDAAQRASKEGDQKDLVTNQTASMTRVLNTQVQMEMSAMKDIAGVGSAADFIQFNQDYANGKHPEITEAQFQQKKLMFNAYVSRVQTTLSNMSSGYAPTVGGDTAQAAVKNAMAPLLAQQAFVNNKEDGPAFHIAHQVEAIKDQSTFDFLINKDYGKEAQVILGARSILGDGYLPTYITSINESGADLKFAKTFNQEGMAAINPYTDTRGQPIPRYMADAIDHGKKIGGGGAEDPNYVGSIIGLVDHIADPQMPQAGKDRMINWAFNPKNVGRLDELKMDYKDPQTGQTVPGKYAAFNILSSPKIVAAVAENSKTKPENYQMFQGTLTTEFGKLYRTDAVSLNEILQQASKVTPNANISDEGRAKLQSQEAAKIHFSFDNETGHFGLVDGNNRPVTRVDKVLTAANPASLRTNNALDILDRMNGGVDNYRNVLKNNPQGPGDINTYVLQTLQTMGFRPGDNITGGTPAMMAAVIKANNPDISQADLVKKVFGSPGGVTPTGHSNFAPEDDNSVQSFVNNPVGGSRGNYRTAGSNLDMGSPKAPMKRTHNLSDEQLMSIDTQDIPEGMSAQDFIKQLQKSRR